MMSLTCYEKIRRVGRVPRMLRGCYEESPPMEFKGLSTLCDRCLWWHKNPKRKQAIEGNIPFSAKSERVNLEKLNVIS